MRFVRRLWWQLSSFVRSLFMLPRLLIRSLVQLVTRFIGACSRFPLLLIGAVFGLARRIFERWIKAARGRDLLFGLPALVVLIFLTAIVLLSLRGNLARKVTTYDSAARQAAARGDYEAAKLYLKRVLQSGADRPGTRFELSKLAIENGDSDTANMLLADLAPVDRPVQYEAHLWRAKQLLTRGNVGTEEIIEAESQLINAILLRRDSALANSLLGQLYQQTNRYQEARDHFLRVEPRSPTDELFLAHAHQALDESLLAQAAAERARQSFAARYARNPNDLESLLKLAAALRFMNRYEEVEQMLGANTLLSAEPQLKHERTMNLIAWADSLPDESTSLRPRLELIRRALRVNPRETLVYDRILQVMLKGSEFTDRLRKALQQELANGTAPDLIHLLLGIDATTREDSETAVYHYRAALRIDPALSVAANNLAWTLMALDPPQLREAEAVITELCNSYPENPVFAETHGQVLLRSGKYTEALEAFEQAIDRLAYEPSIHRGMAEAYDAIGMMEMAAAHREWLESNAKNGDK